MNGSRRSRALILALGAILGSLSGCSKPLFPRDEQRSQFDRVDRARNQYEPQYVEDAFGRREPNLRGRLSPK